MTVRSLAIALVFLTGACRQGRVAVSSFNVADPGRASQVIDGFYAVEVKGSRWSGREFTVALAPPPGASDHGARLWLRLYIPEQQLRAIGAMTLSASIDGTPLARRTFENGGIEEYSSEVPAGLLDTNLVPVCFSFDRATTPSKQESRQLGAVIIEAGLATK